jgi:hypothetical protein
MRLKYACCAATAALISAPAAAQTRSGVSFDQTITTVHSTAGRVDSATNVIHALTAGSNMRIETTNNTLYPNMGAFSPGPHAVLLIRDGGAETVFLNPDSKEYLSVKPLEMMTGFRKMLESMGGSMTFDTSATRMTVDSVGPGPSIDGHPTVHYTMTTAMKATISVMGESMANENRSVTEIYSAPDMADFRDAAEGVMSQFAEAVRSMGMGDEMFEKMKQNQQMVRGFPLRLVKHSTLTQRGQTRTSTEIIESRNAHRVSAPDSLFAIPAGYKAVSMPVFPGAGRENAP